MAAVLKTARASCVLVGSNPTPSALTSRITLVRSMFGGLAEPDGLSAPPGQSRWLPVMAGGSRTIRGQRIISRRLRAEWFRVETAAGVGCGEREGGDRRWNSQGGSGATGRSRVTVYGRPATVDPAATT